MFFGTCEQFELPVRGRTTLTSMKEMLYKASILISWTRTIGPFNVVAMIDSTCICLGKVNGFAKIDSHGVTKLLLIMHIV